jgi:hypothetical protein
VANGGDFMVLYEITRLVVGVGLNPAAYVIFLNGTVQISTQFGYVGSTNNTTKVVVGPAILTIPDGAALTVRNVGGTSDTLAVTADGVTIINASFRLVR